jgi:hypothetical protein
MSQTTGTPTQTIAHVGQHLDRKRTLPRRVLKLALRLATLPAGDHVLIVNVPTVSTDDLIWREGILK